MIYGSSNDLPRMIDIRMPFDHCRSTCKGERLSRGKQNARGPIHHPFSQHFGILTEEAVASMTKLGDMGLIDTDQLRGMEVVKPVYTRHGVRYKWEHNMRSYEPRDVPERM